MEKFDFLNKDKIIAVLKYGMECGVGAEPATASYIDDDFKIEFSFSQNEPTVIVYASIAGESNRKIDYNLSDMATQFAKEQLKIQQLQSRLKGISGKFNDILP